MYAFVFDFVEFFQYLLILLVTEMEDDKGFGHVEVCVRVGLIIELSLCANKFAPISYIWASLDWGQLLKGK